MRVVLLIVALLVFMPAGYARDAEGRLDLILSPNNTRPSLVLPGMSFEVLAREAVDLELIFEGGLFPLKVDWAESGEGVVRGICVMPEGVPIGSYSLRGSTGSKEDRNFRSVYVYEAYPETYRVARMSGMRIGDDEGRDTQVYRSVQAINESGASLVLVTGDLTAAGTASQFSLALDFLDGCVVPTFVYPGEADIAQGLSGDYLGKMPFAFRFGPDGYLGHRLSVSLETDWSGSAGRLHLLRRFLRPVRWSVGVLGGYKLGSNIREQLILFNDDPLDYAFLSSPRNEADSVSEFAWGRTEAFGEARLGRGVVSYYAVDVGGVARVGALNE